MLVIRKKKGLAGIKLMLDEIGELKLKEVLAVPFYHWEFGFFAGIGWALIGLLAAMR